MKNEKSIIPKNNRKEWFGSLRTKTDKQLKEIGLLVWNKSGRSIHYLYPSDWYDKIPNGLTIVSIGGNTEKFKPGITDNDSRYGALAYGFIITKKVK